jgi:branched-chain amino acid transport system ATP-binding protein
MLRVNALEVNYGAISALHGVTLEANGGEIVAVVGANGGGKSTLLKTIAGFLRPKAGEITLDAKSLAGLSVEQRVRRGVALVPEGRQIWAELTVEEHLRLGCFGRRRERRLFQERLESVYTLFPRLFERRRQRGGTLSGGEQQMLAIGRALISQPSVLLLDEPTLGLAPVVIESIGETLASARSPERTVIVAEQNVDFALAIADRGYVLEVGEVRLEGEADELRGHPELLDAYLGLAPQAHH